MPPEQRQPAVARVRRAAATAVDRRRVLTPGKTVLVACSGGPDSMALLDVLAHLAAPRGWRLHVCHVDHGLRADSAKDAALVAAAAEQRGLAFDARRVTLAAGGSLQERARDARRGALLEAAHAAGAGVIALGHTADDQAETVLMRLLTTGSVTGIAAMRERTDGLARPLLRVWRAETAAYCEALRLATVDDPSNRDRRFLRVRLRLEVIPMLEVVAPGARRRLLALAARQQLLLQTAGRELTP